MTAITRSTNAPSNDERRAAWAFRYFLRGFHRQPQKPRMRIPVTVPLPRESVRAAPAGQAGASPIPRAAGVTVGGVHSPPTPAVAHTAEDWFSGPECAAILAQPVEPCTENPFVGDREPSEIDA